MIEPPTLLTQRDAAQLLKCSEGKLARERRLGRLAYIPGRPVMLKLQDVLDWLDRRRVAVKPVPNYDPMRAADRVLRRRKRTTP
jgi:hypothetical protein